MCIFFIMPLKQLGNTGLHNITAFNFALSEYNIYLSNNKINKKTKSNKLLLKTR